MYGHTECSQRKKNIFKAILDPRSRWIWPVHSPSAPWVNSESTAFLGSLQNTPWKAVDLYGIWFHSIQIKLSATKKYFTRQFQHAGNWGYFEPETKRVLAASAPCMICKNKLNCDHGNWHIVPCNHSNQYVVPHLLSSSLSCRQAPVPGWCRGRVS